MSRFLKQPGQNFPLFGDFDIIVHRSKILTNEDPDLLDNEINQFWLSLIALPSVTPIYLSTEFQVILGEPPAAPLFSVCLNFQLVG